MTALKASAAVAFAAGQIFAIGLLIAILARGYGDDAFSMAILLAVAAVIFGGPAVWLQQYKVQTWLWAGTQAALTSAAAVCAYLAHISPEGGALAGPLVVAATVPVPFLYLGAASMSHRIVMKTGIGVIVIAVLLSLPIARL